MNTILSNAVSSIQIGVDDFELTDARRALSAIRNITAGVLLLYKEKLRQLSPPDSDEVLLRQRVSPKLVDGVLRFVGKGPKTVDVFEIKERFKALGIFIDERLLDEVVSHRNAVEHYLSEAAPGTLKVVIAKSFKLISQFCQKHLDLEPIELFGHIAWSTMLQESDLFDEQLARCQEALMALPWPNQGLFSEFACEFRCMMCGSGLLMPKSSVGHFSDYTFTCLHCEQGHGYLQLLEPVLEEVYSPANHISTKDGGESLTDACAACDMAAFIIEHDVCLACGYQRLKS